MSRLRSVRRRPWLRWAACGLLIAPLVLAADVAPEGRQAAQQDPELRALLDRFDEVQNTIRTLSADLKMTTKNRLLRDPVVYQGRFYMTKPNSVRWEFDSPEEMRFVIARDEYVGYYPAQKKAERKSIKRWSTQLFRYFGLGQRSEELAKFYEISLEEESELEGCSLLVMKPKKRRARKRVEDVRFWVDDGTLLPVRVEYRSVDGDTRTVEFDDMQLNVELAAGLYEVELPADVQVTTGFTPFGGDPGS
jgi:outer membrane lipoprotein-sorting protein